LLPYIARTIYGTNQTGLGYLSASFAVGSLVGSIVLSLVGGIRVARADDCLERAVVRDLAAVRADADRADGDRLPGAAGFSAELAMISIAVILMRTAAENFRAG